jgi:hypothetical protein
VGTPHLEHCCMETSSYTESNLLGSQASAWFSWGPPARCRLGYDVTGLDVFPVSLQCGRLLVWIVGSPVAQPAPYEEKERLVDAYGAAVNEYGRTVNMLKHRLGVLPKADYDQMRTFSEEACVRCETARAALDRHIHEHGTTLGLTTSVGFLYAGTVWRVA